MVCVDVTEELLVLAIIEDLEELHQLSASRSTAEERKVIIFGIIDMLRRLRKIELRQV